MKRRLRAPSPAVVISLIALFVALGGTAYASGLISGKQIVNHSIPAKKLTAAAINGLQGKRGPAGRSFHLMRFDDQPVLHRLTTANGIDVSYKCEADSRPWQVRFVLAPHAGGKAIVVSGNYSQDGVMKSVNQHEIADFTGQTVNVHVIARATGKVVRIDLGGLNPGDRRGHVCDVWGLITPGT